MNLLNQEQEHDQQQQTTVFLSPCCSNEAYLADDDAPSVANTTLSKIEKGSLSSHASKETSVSFGTVEVREYERIIVGDHNDKLGLGIGWSYNQHTEAMPMEPLFFPKRTCSHPTYCGYSSVAEKIDLLIDYGFSMQELRQAEMSRQEMMYGSNQNRDGKDKYFDSSHLPYRGKVAGWILSGLVRKGRKFVIQRTRPWMNKQAAKTPGS